MLTPEGQVKVLDFGLSGGGQTGLQLGTPVYMAPELVSERPDARSDLYALGITLFQLLYRRPAYRGGSVHALLLAHATEPLRFPREPAVPASVQNVIARLCAKEPDQRFASANQVIEALTQATGRAYAVETRDTRLSYLSGKLVGREAEKQTLLAYCLTRTRGATSDEAVLAAVAGVSGLGKSQQRQVKKQLQLAGVLFVGPAATKAAFPSS